LPRQRRGGSWNPEVPGGGDTGSGYGAPSEGQSGASPRQLGGSRGAVEGGNGVSEECYGDVILRREAGQAADEGAKKSEQGQEGAAGCHRERPGEGWFDSGRCVDVHATIKIENKKIVNFCKRHHISQQLRCTDCDVLTLIFVSIVAFKDEFKAVPEPA